jgi:BirA family biotin operon repressor/biotin-[acetyl-CoA-carboxylase] ligase
MTAQLHQFERVDSTMDVLHALAEAGAEPGTAVLAREQLQGRGSRGRSWHSPPGGLWLSVLFRPPVGGGVEIISLRAGLAVAQSLDGLVPEPIRLKWPNDLMLGDRKTGGILGEARWQGPALGWVAVGVGLNVQNGVPLEVRERATWLALEHPGLTPEVVAGPVLAVLRRLDLGPAELSAAELGEFARRDWLYGRELRTPLSGTAAGITREGALRVRRPGGEAAEVRSGSVELAPVPSAR